ncbi:MAG TPA: leucyl aminopeptidase [Woeseiaceae bacterium]|nr:leucyl aminopeptidase [Woeseiaceae bacterium]
MEYFSTTSKLSQRATDCLIVGVYSKSVLSIAAAEINLATKGEIKRLLKSGDASGHLGHTLVLQQPSGVKAKRIVVVGLGKQAKFDVVALRKALAAALGAVAKTKCRALLVGLTQEPGITPYYAARATAETVHDVLYNFTEMKSAHKKPRMPLAKIGLANTERSHAKHAMLGAEHGEAIALGMSLAKNLGNQPPNVCTPSHLARTAQKLARENARVSTRVLNEAEMKRLGMGSLLSVTAGAAEPAKFIIMEYKGAGKSAPVVLVGKGVTFDTGGTSLKPGAAMDEMKYDMCGAASVIGTIAAVAALKLPINLNVVVPAVVNMPGGSATVPGDIVKSMSGQTIEILNTDAEGRLILCDALTYARRFKPAAIIDVATLTGACVIALGKYHAGLMSNDDELADSILAAGLRASDRAWRLPMGDDYASQLKSNFADMANIGGRDAGTITAACFLGKFTTDMVWAHLDIAGVAWLTGAKKGATGRPVPLLTEILLARAGVLPA